MWLIMEPRSINKYAAVHVPQSSRQSCNSFLKDARFSLTPDPPVTVPKISSFHDSVFRCPWVQMNITDPLEGRSKKEKKWSGYYKIARHYKFALDKVFAHPARYV